MTGERLIDTTIYDVIVAGLGPAGLTACLYAARDGLKVLGLDPAGCGGKLLTIDNLENYPFPGRFPLHFQSCRTNHIRLGIEN